MRRIFLMKNPEGGFECWEGQLTGSCRCKWGVERGVGQKKGGRREEQEREGKGGRGNGSRKGHSRHISGEMHGQHWQPHPIMWTKISATYERAASFENRVLRRPVAEETSRAHMHPTALLCAHDRRIAQP